MSSSGFLKLRKSESYCGARLSKSKTSHQILRSSPSSPFPANPVTPTRSQLRRLSQEIAHRYQPTKNPVPSEGQDKCSQIPHKPSTTERRSSIPNPNQTDPGKETPELDLSIYYYQLPKRKELSQRLQKLTAEIDQKKLVHEGKREKFNLSGFNQGYDKRIQSQRQGEYNSLQIEFYENEFIFYEKEVVRNQLQKELDWTMADYYDKQITHFEKKMEETQRHIDFYKEGGGAQLIKQNWRFEQRRKSICSINS